jgi:hypothetical protein
MEVLRVRTWWWCANRRQRLAGTSRERWVVKTPASWAEGGVAMKRHHAISANSHRDTQACVDSISAQLPLPEKHTSARVVGAWAQALEDMIETFVVHEFYCGD